MAKPLADGKADVIDLKSEDGCPAAWPTSFINMKPKPKVLSEVNPWEDLNKVLAIRVAQDKEHVKLN